MLLLLVKSIKFLLTCQLACDVTVTLAFIQRLPWLPDLVQIELPIELPVLVYTFRVPMVVPYMW